MQLCHKSNKPFRYRGRWRATMRLANGTRPTKDFESYEDALLFLAQQRALEVDDNAPELGGPTVVTLAEALNHYAKLMTVAKKGAKAKLNRINHYLKAAGLPVLKLVPVEQTTGKGAWSLAAHEPTVPKGFTAHLKRRQAQGNLVAQVIVAMLDRYGGMWQCASLGAQAQAHRHRARHGKRTDCDHW